MRIFSFSYSDSLGGAARAAYRIHHAVRQLGIESELFVNQKKLPDDTVRGPKSLFHTKWNKFRSGLGVLISKFSQKGSRNYFSSNLVPSFWSIGINQSNADLVHLHWIHGEMMSINDIGRINKPIIWTLHDMWAFCGAEHYPEHQIWKSGYKSKVSSNQDQFDLNQFVWEYKKKKWIRPFQIVTPSIWLAECVKQSALMKNWPIEVIPNPINTDIWKPEEKIIARKALNLPSDENLILFGAAGGASDERKGFKFLHDALKKIRNSKNIGLVVFGAEKNNSLFNEIGIPIYHLGYIDDEQKMCQVYSAADVLVAPSKMEIFGQTATEAHACGCPAVVFDNTGLAEIVSHQETGYIAKMLDVDDLANGIDWVIEKLQKSSEMRLFARQRVMQKYSNNVVAAQYKELYERALKNEAKFPSNSNVM